MDETNAFAVFDTGCYIGCVWQSINLERELWNAATRDGAVLTHEMEWASSKAEALDWLRKKEEESIFSA